MHFQYIAAVQHVDQAAYNSHNNSRDHNTEIFSCRYFLAINFSRESDKDPQVC